jgi:HSP20 family protein
MLPSTIRRRDNPTTWDEGSDLNRLFNLAFGSAPSFAGWTPSVDVQEDKEAFVVTAELPGLAAADVDVSVENGVLSISGEKREQREEGGEGTSHHLMERRYGKFQRNFSLPRSVDADKVAAKFENGILEVTLPKSAAAKPRRIKVGA